MRLHLRALLLLALPALVTGCMGTNEDQDNDGGTGTPSGGADGGTGGNATAEEIANGTLTLGPNASNVLPGSNASVSMPVNFTAGYTTVIVNTTIEQGTSVGLRFSGPGDCTGTIDGPIVQGRTYTRECANVPPGDHNLTYAHTSGTVTLRVVVLGQR